MADIRINSLPTTASASSSDDFLALDGATNGTRKLNAFSPTFGGNLTVSGAGTSSFAGVVTATGNGTFGGNSLAGNRILTVSNTATAHGAWASMAVDTSVSGLKLAHLSSGWSGTFLTGGPTTTQSAIYTTSSAPIVFGVNSTYVGKAESTGWTLAGDLTVSGTGTHSFAGQVTSTVNAANTSNLGSFVASNATLNSFTSYSPSASLDQKYWTWQSGTAIGDGTIRLRALNDAQNNGINAITVTRSGISSTAVTIGGNLTVSGTGNNIFNSGGGNFLIGTTIDGGQKLQVNGTAAITGNLTVGNSNTNQLLTIQSATAGTGQGAALVLKNNTTTIGYFGRSSYISSGAVNTDAPAIAGTTGLGLNFFVNDSTNALALASTGAATFAGAVTVNGATASGINASGSFDWIASRANTSSSASYQYKTGATLNWYHGLRGLANNNWYLFNNATSANTLIFDAATDAATFAGTVTTKGSTLSAINNTNVSTTATDIAIATSVGGLYFVTGYNTSGGAQGTWLLMMRGSNVTTISSDNNTGLTVTYSVSAGKLQAATASGTIALIATAITR